MRRMFQWALAAALICGISFAAASCSNDDNPATPQRESKTVLVGMDLKGHPFYGDLTYSDTYNYFLHWGEK